MLYRWSARFAVVAVVLLAALAAGRFGELAIAAPGRAAMEVEVDDNYFKPKTLTVQAGTTVKWGNEGKHEHTVTADNGAFGSGDLESSDAFSFTFTKAGTYAYFCKYHGGKGGVGMSGTIVVTAAAASMPSRPTGSTSSPKALPNTGASDVPAITLLAIALLIGVLGLTLRGRGSRAGR